MSSDPRDLLAAAVDETALRQRYAELLREHAAEQLGVLLRLRRAFLERRHALRGMAGRRGTGSERADGDG